MGNAEMLINTTVWVDVRGVDEIKKPDFQKFCSISGTTILLGVKNFLHLHSLREQTSGSSSVGRA